MKLCNSLFPLAANRIIYQANNNEVKHKCDRGRSPPMSRGRWSVRRLKSERDLKPGIIHSSLRTCRHYGRQTWGILKFKEPTRLQDLNELPIQQVTARASLISSWSLWCILAQLSSLFGELAVKTRSASTPLCGFHRLWPNKFKSVPAFSGI